MNLSFLIHSNSPELHEYVHKKEDKVEIMYLVAYLIYVSKYIDADQN